MRFASILRLALVAAVLTVMSSGAAFADWRGTRDKAMQMREAGNAAQAYQSVAGYGARSAKDINDRDFLAGFLALRGLGRADVALAHFQAMAMSTSGLPAWQQPERRAQAGYWLGRTLDALGRAQDARSMYVAAAAYRDTFYGQMAASQAALDDTTSVLSGYASSYPDMEIFWYDSRIRKELVLSIIRAESSFKQNAVSPAGAKGLMQIMDGTALRVGKASGVNIDLSLVAANQHYNVAVGSKLVADLLQRYGGNVLLMAAAYNAGEGKADEWVRRFGDPRGGRIDPVDWIELIPYGETREYVKKIVSGYVTYIAISSGRSS